MSEAALQKKLLLQLKQIPNVFCYKAQALSIRGIPDIVCCANGLFFGIEVKTSKGKTSPLQDLVLKKINKAGGVGIVARPENASQIIEIIKIVAGGRRDVENILPRTEV